jgi:hypothetical protein
MTTREGLLMHVTMSRPLGKSAPLARLMTALVLVLIVGGAGLLPAAESARAQQDSRYFQDTGFRIDNDKIWDYFSKRGGKRTFGLPTSRTFQFLGMPTQFFQRHVLQVASGGVQTLNLLDEGLLSYTTIGGSTFPTVDPSVVAAAPKPGTPTYDADLPAYLATYAPDAFEGEPVKFAQTFSSTVTLADAFPDGGGSDGLLTLLNLEIWGLPTAKPTRDPGNSNFVFARFQRGIMHYDAACKCTQGLLLADALKEIITGENLPDDLAAQAASSPLFGQYDTSLHNGPLHEGLPGGIELANAFRPSLDTAAAGAVPPITASPATAAQPAASAKPSGATETPAAAAATPKPAASGPPSGDPKVFLTKPSESGKGSEEQAKEAKSGKDDRMVWASNRIERDRTNANYNSGPVTIYSKSIITSDPDTAKAVFEDEAKVNEKFPEAKDKFASLIPFNMEGDEDVGEQAKGASACAVASCAAKDGDNQLHRRMVFRINRFVGVIYTFGLDVPEGNTQAYTRQFAQRMVKKMRDSI